MSSKSKGADNGAEATPSEVAQQAMQAGQPFWNACEAYWHSMDHYASEMAHFLHDRCAKDAEFARQMARCDSPLDAVRLQQGWFAIALRDYMTESAKLGQIVARDEQSATLPAMAQLHHLFETWTGARAMQ